MDGHYEISDFSEVSFCFGRIALWLILISVIACFSHYAGFTTLYSSAFLNANKILTRRLSNVLSNAPKLTTHGLGAFCCSKMRAYYYMLWLAWMLTTICSVSSLICRQNTTYSACLAARTLYVVSNIWVIFLVSWFWAAR